MSSFVASIIIPSYNCAAWLKAAVESAYCFGPGAVEVIIVDDGSTDETPSLCASLKSQFSDLIVIRQANGGLSSARNAGIAAATGEFIVLLDADDELVPFDLSVLQKFDGDILRIGVEEITVNGESREWVESIKSLTGPVYLQQHLADNSLYVPSWAYLYRRHFLQDNQLRFTHGLIHEDMLFTVQALLKARCVWTTKAILYRYIRREGSITLQLTSSAIHRRIASLSHIAKAILAMGNQHPDVDLWRWAEHVTDYAWSFAHISHSRKMAWQVLRMEWDLLICCSRWGSFRTRRSVIWRLRRGLSRLVAV